MAESYPLYARDSPALSDFERGLYDDASREKPWELVEKFSTLHRHPGSEDERTAAEYICDRFDEYGVPYERYDPDFWIGEPDSVSLRTVTPVERTFDSGDRPAVKAHSFSPSGTFRGEVVRLPIHDVNNVNELRGITLSDLNATDLDIEGKIALVDQPIQSKQLIEELEDRGAVGYVIVHPHPEEPHSEPGTPIWGAIPHPDEQHLLPDIPLINVSQTVGDELIDLLEGDDTVELELTTDVPRRWETSPLVVAKVPGEANPDNDDFVLLHGHFDSYWAGVTDNATGNAGMVECARLFNEHREEMERDLWVAFWPAHEGGRYGGSTWFADEFALELEERGLAHVNFDSPGAADATEFDDMIVWMPEADEVCRQAIYDVTGKEAKEFRPRRAGDYSFNNLGLTGMLCLNSSIPQEVRDERGYHPVAGGGGNSDAWHLTTNTLDKADPDVLLRDIRVYLVILSRLLTSEVVPLDYRRTVQRHREIVDEYDATAADHFDLAPVLDELDELEPAVERFYRDVETGSVEAETANETIRRLSRRLVRLNFTTEGKFVQDPATYRPPYPSLEPATELPDLSGDEYRFQRTHLKRARNAAVHSLRRARRTAERAVTHE